MEDLTLKVTQEQIQEALQKAIPKFISESYDSPVRKVVERAITEKEGEIKKLVDSVISDALINPEFRQRIGDVVLNKMVESALKGKPTSW